MTILEELLNEIRIIILHLHTKTLTTEFSVFTQSHRCVCVCVWSVSAGIKCRADVQVSQVQLSAVLDGSKCSLRLQLNSPEQV